MTVTEKQQQVLDYMKRFQARQGFLPSLREICHALGLASPGSLVKHLRALEAEGQLSRSPGKKRAWKLARPLGPPTIPLLGRIAAGAPLLAEENREDEIPIDPTFFGSETCFALKVKGDSMVEAHISDGDLAVIRPGEEADDGQIVAVLVEGAETEATLKILRRRNGKLELHPANAGYQPLVFRGRERSRVRILGRLAGVIRIRP